MMDALTALRLIALNDFRAHSVLELTAGLHGPAKVWSLGSVNHGEIFVFSCLQQSKQKRQYLAVKL